MGVLIPGALQEIVEQGGYVIDVDSAVLVAIGCQWRSLSSHQNIDQVSHVVDVDFAITVNVTHEYIFHNLPEIGIPVLISPVGISRPLQHMQRATRIV